MDTKQIKLLAKFTEKWARIPILQCFCIHDGIARATDMDVQISFPTNAPDGIYNSKASAKIGELISAELPISDFPQSPDIELLEHSISTDILKRVNEFASTEATRYQLNGIYLDPAGKVTATDGHRMMVYDCYSPFDHMPAIIPSATIDKLPKGRTIKYGLDGKRITFRYDDITITSKLIDAKYPDYMRAIPAIKTPYQNLPDDWHAQVLHAKKLGKAMGKKHANIVSFGTLNLNAYIADVLPADLNAYNQTTPSDPALFIVDNETYVIMPMRA